MTNDMGLMMLIGYVESSHDQYAMRYEPLHFPKSTFVLRAQDANHCTKATAKQICKTSWGLYQIMGDELYALGFGDAIGYYLSSTTTQNNYFRKFLQANYIDYTLEDIIKNPKTREHFARVYNGPKNVKAYSQHIMTVFNAHPSLALYINEKNGSANNV